MILTVARNPAVNRTWHVDGPTLGATLRMPPGISRPGGKGLNAALVLDQNGNELLVLARACGATSIFNEVSVPVSPTDSTACL